MFAPLRGLKRVAKRSPRLVQLNHKLRWRLHILKDWWGTKMWRRTSEVMTPLGFRLRSGFHPAYEQMRQGTFEPEETQVILRQLRQSDRFIDVGANLGYYTCLALQQDRPGIAFEPQPQNLACLYNNLQANGWDDRAEVFPVALSEKPGLLSLFGASGPSASLLPNWAGYSSKHQQTVPVSTLDNVLADRFDGEQLFVKVDVEGAEHQVLKGAVRTLARSPKPSWLMEICLHEFHPEGVNPDFSDIFELFWSHGYRAYTATVAPREVTRDDVRSWVAARASGGGTFNYLFLSADREP